MRLWRRTALNIGERETKGRHPGRVRGSAFKLGAVSLVGTLGGVTERRLISMISAKGKSPEQLKAEVVAAYQKWQDAQQAAQQDAQKKH